MIVEHRFAHIPQDARRGRAWIASHAPLAEVRLDPAATVPIDAFHRYHHLGEAILGEFDGPAQTTERSGALVARQALDHLVLRVHVRGRARIAVDGRTDQADPGDIVLLHLARPVRIETEPASGVEFVLPRRAVTTEAYGIPVRHGQVLSVGGHPLTRLMADHLRNLPACLTESPAVRPNSLVLPTLALCRVLLSIATVGGVHATPEELGITVRRFIETHLATIDVATLAEQFGLSTRSLYRLFPDGGVSAFIRERRLAGAMRQLVQPPAGRPPKLALLSHDHGFNNSRVFSRAFHRRYGLWPGEVRRDRPCVEPVKQAPPPLAWLQDL